MNKQTLDIQHLATLARLKIEPEQEIVLNKELNDIITMIDTLQQADTRDVDPLAHPLDQSQPLRQDQVTETDQRSELQENAPDTQDGLFIVPQFIETE